MYVAVLGPLEVRDGESPVAISGSRVRRLLIRLSVDSGRTVSADELEEAVWPDDPPANVHNALQALVSRLRRALPATTLEQVGNGYRLRLEPGCLDVDEFTRLSAKGREELAGGDAATAATTLREAVALWRGEALADAGDALYAQALSVRWNEQRLTVLADLARAAIDSGGAAEQVAGLQELTTTHPLRDDFVELLMRALDSAGRTPEALAEYERHRELLADELGSDPTPALQGLHLALLQAEPVQAATGGRSNVPTPLTRLVGRDEEVGHLTKLLAAGRLATIVGPGGAGKTRLATEVVDRTTAAAGSDVRAWFVDLAPVTELTGVVQAFGAVDGLLDRHVVDVPGGDRMAVDPIERLIDWLQPRDAILLVDNCEQVIGPAAEITNQLLRACPRLRILATSREPLNIPGESILQLSPLSFPDEATAVEEAMAHPAVQLFVERARDASSTFELDEANLGSVVRIVRRLDGLPLALELAAARLRVLPVAEVERRLTDRFTLLTGGNRTAMPRHQTLRAVVEWSWDLLGDDERLLLERLAVFPSGADPEAAVGVCADSLLAASEIPGLLDALVDKSLLKLNTDEGLRYRMLDTIRAFGNERLQVRREAVIARRAHAAYFRELVRTIEPVLRTGDQLPALATFSLERDNILTGMRFYGEQGDVDAAMDVAMMMSWYWTMMGSHAEAAYWTKFALDVAPGGDPRTRTVLETFYLMGSLATDSSEAGTWDRVRARMLSLSEQLGDYQFDDGPLTALRPMVTYFAGDAETAEKLTLQALQSTDPWTRAATHTFRAAMAENEGNVERMRADLDAAAPDLELIGDRWLIGSSYSTRARIRTLEGDLDGAVEDYTRATAAMEDIGAPDDVAFSHLRLAELAIRQGDLAAARRHADALMEVTTDWRPGELFYTAMMLALARLEDDRETGDEYYAQLRDGVVTLSAAHPIEDHTRAIQMGVLASYDLWCDRIDKAREWLAIGYPAALDTHDMPIVAHVGVVVADLARALDLPERSAEVLGAAAAVRGADDPTDPEVIRITTSLRVDLGDAFDAAYDKGRRLSRDEALLALDPAAI